MHLYENQSSVSLNQGKTEITDASCIYRHFPLSETSLSSFPCYVFLCATLNRYRFITSTDLTVAALLKKKLGCLVTSFTWCFQRGRLDKLQRLEEAGLSRALNQQL